MTQVDTVQGNNTTRAIIPAAVTTAAAGAGAGIIKYATSGPVKKEAGKDTFEASQRLINHVSKQIDAAKPVKDAAGELIKGFSDEAAARNLLGQLGVEGAAEMTLDAAKALKPEAIVDAAQKQVAACDNALKAIGAKDFDAKGLAEAVKGIGISEETVKGFGEGAEAVAAATKHVQDMKDAVPLKDKIDGAKDTLKNTTDSLIDKASGKFIEVKDGMKEETKKLIQTFKQNRVKGALILGAIAAAATAAVFGVVTMLKKPKEGKEEKVEEKAAA